MKWLITGGTGLIGSVLARMLAKDGADVNILSRSPKKAVKFRQAGMHFFVGDITQPETLPPALKGCDGIFHLAAYAKGWAEDPSVYTLYNVEGTRNLLEAALAQGIKRVVLTSTAGILGPASGAPTNEESSFAGPYFTPYEESKAIADHLGREYLSRGLEIITVFPTRVFGPGKLGDSNAVARIIKLYAEGKWRILPGNGQRTGNYVFVEDVASGMLLAMQKGKPGSRYILGGDNLSFREMFSIIGSSTGKKRVLIPLPLALMYGAVVLFRLISLLTGKPPLITAAWLKRYMQDWAFSSAKAEAELGYTHRPFGEGVKITWDYFRKRGKSDKNG